MFQQASQPMLTKIVGSTWQKLNWIELNWKFYTSFFWLLNFSDDVASPGQSQVQHLMCGHRGLMGWSWLKQHPPKIFNTLDYILCTKKWLENIGCFAFVTTDEHFCEQVWSLHFYLSKNVSTFYVHNFNPLHLNNQKFVH